MRPIASVAATATPFVAQRAKVLAARVTKGVQDGKITNDQVSGIQDQLNAVIQQRNEFAADGTISKEERYALHQNLRGISESLYKLMHPQTDEQAEGETGQPPAIDVQA